MKIQDNVFLVTGGGSGLGAATARRLAHAGARVAIVDVDATGGRSVAADLGEAACYIAADVCDEAQVAAAVQEVTRRYTSLHGVMNCAGVAPPERVLGKTGPHSLETFRRVINVNLIGTFNVMRLAASAISKTEPLANGERGVLVNTASIAAFDGQIGQIAYSASKGGVVGMTLPAARDLSPAGVRVVTIAPGLMDTPLLGLLPEEGRQALGAGVLFPKRLGDPDEFAQLVQQIVENGYINGEVIRLDGGLRMPPK
jgi:NAD(P)-dependent dehydrogenase (short-subunit alcohol dehydrogenase family)